jgi:hypothetical protein
MPVAAEKPECDLVMKGGITSGVVYPPAVLELSRKYRFRRIGGASAGAIAAATTAAAQYGEQSGAPGFERLREVSGRLAEGSRLRGLFQAPRETRPLLKILFDFVTPASHGAGVTRFVFTLAWVLMRRLPGAFLLGASATLSAALLYGWLIYRSLPYLGDDPAAHAQWAPPLYRKLSLLAVAAALACLGGVLACLVRFCVLLTRAARADPYFFGICPGTAPADAGPGPPALTEWLDRQLEYVAGRCD